MQLLKSYLPSSLREQNRRNLVLAHILETDPYQVYFGEEV